MDYNELQRFLDRLRVDDSGCWLWCGGRTSAKYGAMLVKGKQRSTHRLAYEHWVGTIPNNLELDHLCRIRHCVNPDHLEPVTRQVNLNRSPIIGHRADTHCKRGHVFSPENTCFSNNGRSRRCRACDREVRAPKVRQRIQTLRGYVGHLKSSTCAHGHMYDAQNTRIERDGSRKCRRCDSDRHMAKYYQAKGER